MAFHDWAYIWIPLYAASACQAHIAASKGHGNAGVDACCGLDVLLRFDPGLA